MIGTSQPRIQVSPHTTLVDERVQIQLFDFEPRQLVTLQVHMDSILGLPCDAVSEVTVQADDEGRVDLDQQAPVSGSYTTADAMGVFWSMQMSNVQWTRTRVNEEFPYEPREATVHLKALVDGNVVAETSCVRQFVRSDVRMVNVTEPGVVAKYFYREDAPPAPAILCLGGGEGGLAAPMTLAGLLASHGYPALALAYFNFENLPQALKEIPLEFFETAIAWLKSQPQVLDGQIAAFGSSKGAELALLLGTVYPDIAAVIACSPTAIPCVGSVNPRFDGSGYSTFSSWSYQGKPLPYESWNTDMCREALERLQAGERIDDIHHKAFVEAKDVDDIAIPVERIHGPVMLISCGDDHWWPATVYSEYIVDRLKKHNFQHEVIHAEYPNAGHVVRFPYIPTTQLRMNGGTPQANSHASADAWAKTMQFLAYTFKAHIMA